MRDLASNDKQTSDAQGGQEERHQIRPIDSGHRGGSIRVARSCHGGKCQGNDQEDNDLLHNFASKLVMNLTIDRIGWHPSAMPAACKRCKRAVSRVRRLPDSGSGVDNAE